MKTKLVCPQCQATMSVVSGIDTEVKCPLCRVPMQPEDSGGPPKEPGQAAKPSFPSIKVARPVGDFTRTGDVGRGKPATPSQTKPPPTGATTITKTATPVSINLPDQAGATAETSEQAEKILASARRQAEELANDVISRADQEAQEILNTADQQVQPRGEKLIREAEEKAARIVADSKRKAEEEAAGAARTIRRKAEEEAKSTLDKAQREAMSRKIKITQAQKELDAANKNLESEKQKVAASREEEKKERQRQQEEMNKQREELRKQQEQMRRQREELQEQEKQMRERRQTLQKQQEAARQQELDMDKKKKELDKQLGEAKKKAAEIIAEAEDKARKIKGETRSGTPASVSETAVKTGETRTAEQPEPDRKTVAETEKASEPETADKATMRRHKARMDGYARREAKFITAGISLGMIVLIYCLAVLFLVKNLDSTVRMMTYGVIVLDLLMVGWLTMLIRSHYVKGNEAIKAHRERNAVRRETNQVSAGVKPRTTRKKIGVEAAAKDRKPFVKPSQLGQLKNKPNDKPSNSTAASPGDRKSGTRTGTDKFAALNNKKKSGKQHRNKQPPRPRP